MILITQELIGYLKLKDIGLILPFVSFLVLQFRSYNFPLLIFSQIKNPTITVNVNGLRIDNPTLIDVTNAKGANVSLAVDL